MIKLTKGMSASTKEHIIKVQTEEINREKKLEWGKLIKSGRFDSYNELIRKEERLFDEALDKVLEKELSNDDLLLIKENQCNGITLMTFILSEITSNIGREFNILSKSFINEPSILLESNLLAFKSSVFLKSEEIRNEFEDLNNVNINDIETEIINQKLNKIGFHEFYQRIYKEIDDLLIECNNKINEIKYKKALEVEEAFKIHEEYYKDKKNKFFICD